MWSPWTWTGAISAPLRPARGDLLTIDLADPDALALPLPGLGAPCHVRVWLPCLVPCELRSVRADGSFVAPVAARGRLVVLGDSIAQGFCAEDPARAWPALLADHLGLDLVNQGVGGQVFQPGTVPAAELENAAAVVVELGENYRFEPCAASAVARDVRAFLDEVAAAWPEAPVWVLTTPPHLEGVYPTHPRSCAREVDRVIAEAVARHPRMRLVNAGALLDGRLLERLLADGCDHPGAEGQLMIADRLGFVMDATTDEADARRERALEAVRAEGDVVLPVADALARGGGGGAPGREGRGRRGRAGRAAPHLGARPQARAPCAHVPGSGAGELRLRDALRRARGGARRRRPGARPASWWSGAARRPRWTRGATCVCSRPPTRGRSWRPTPTRST